MSIKYQIVNPTTGIRDGFYHSQAEAQAVAERFATRYPGIEWRVEVAPATWPKGMAHNDPGNAELLALAARNPTLWDEISKMPEHGMEPLAAAKKLFYAKGRPAALV